MTSENYSCDNQVLFQTAEINVLDANGMWRTCRALLDGASQCNFITDSCCQRLGLEQLDLPYTVSGVGQVVSNLKHKCQVSIKSKQGPFKTELSCVVIPKISGEYPTLKFDSSKWNIPRTIALADPNFNQPGEIDLLHGGGIYLSLLCVRQISLGSQKPILQKNRFGWVVGGECKSIYDNPYKCYLSFNSNLQNQLKLFWEIEEVTSNEKVLSIEERECEEIFVKTTSRDKDGRFVIQIPFKDSVSNLGNSREIAKKRFRALEFKLSKDSSLREKYVNFMSEYHSLGHMEEIKLKTVSDNSVDYYFPHHGVWNENSPTTKLRVVFNGSFILQIMVFH
ncbi:uncharacterized protein LOC115884148 [Sitophilus oryzae]|uniref:Uncharacterized protein LOC115884148 n=1 Tax=Sitophilus oryzae TaxID=7048 RepID=A0A6J2Y5J6_SITOR|nr:uncharacterized protein LOC115884148 [Sitophilus oryzae]